MQKLLREYLDERNTKRRKNLRAGVAMLLLAVMVIGCVAGALSQYGVAMTGSVKCGIEEHQHTAECYTKTLKCNREEDPGHIHSEECLPFVCGQEEDPEHVHTVECRDANGAYICGEEEREAHFHSDECYEEVLSCEKEEHIHTDICYNDANADVETAEVWAKQYEGIQWKGIWGEDLVLAAQVQLGYKESIENFTMAEDGTHKGYTRYGAFAGEPYCNWDAAFVSFCLHYAGIQNKDTETPVFPKVNETAKWCEEFEKLKEGNSAFLTGPEGYVPAAGDLIFFQRENEETAVQMGIVASFDQEKNEIHVIEGNSQNEVKENIYPLGEAHITRFLKLAEAEAAYKAEQEAANPQSPDTPTEETPAEPGERGPIFTTEDQENSGDQTEAPAVETIEKVYEGEGFTLTASYAKDADIPENAELHVEELFSEGNEEQYAAREAAMRDALEDETASMKHLLKVSLSADGEEVKPASPVAFTFRLAGEGTFTEGRDAAVVRFTEDIAEALNSEKTEANQATFQTEVPAEIAVGEKAAATPEPEPEEPTTEAPTEVEEQVEIIPVNKSFEYKEDTFQIKFKVVGNAILKEEALEDADTPEADTEESTAETTTAAEETTTTVEETIAAETSTEDTAAETIGAAESTEANITESAANEAVESDAIEETTAAEESAAEKVGDQANTVIPEAEATEKEVIAKEITKTENAETESSYQFKIQFLNEASEKYQAFADYAEEVNDGCEQLLFQVMEYSLYYEDTKLDLSECEVTAEITPAENLKEYAKELKQEDTGNQDNEAENVIEPEVVFSAYTLESGVVSRQNSMLMSADYKASPMTVNAAEEDIVALSADEPGNNPFTVQYYANLPRLKTTGTNAIPVIDTSGKKLPANGKGTGNSPNGNEIKNIYVDDNGNVQYVKQLTEVYSTRNFNYYQAPSIKYFDSLVDNKSYVLKEIWTLNKGLIPINQLSAEQKKDLVCGKEAKQGVHTHDPSCYKANWRQEVGNYQAVKDKVHFTNRPVTENEKAESSTDTYILIDENATLRLVYDVNTKHRDVAAAFYDYDISSGHIYTNVNNAISNLNSGQILTGAQANGTLYYAYTKEAGINSSGNYTGSGTKLAFGNVNTGTSMGENLWNGNLLNKYNGTQSPHPTVNGAYKGCTFGLVTGQVDGKLQYASGVQAPKLFNEGGATGKTSYDKEQYSLKFNQEGDTYTLTAVNNANTNNLHKFSHPSPYEGKVHTGIWTNNFWPMDSAGSFGSNGHDLKFGSYAQRGNRAYAGSSTTGEPGSMNASKKTFPYSDDGLDHNSYFGMRYQVEFELSEEYVGPLEYYFFGDDDMWVFLDDKLVCDIGGVHSSVGEYVNLWDYLQKGSKGKHVLTFYYTERGASGSTCWMQFTLPSVTTLTPDSKDYGTLEVSKKVQREDEDGVIADYAADDEFEFTLYLTDAAGNPLRDDYSYVKYANNSTDPTEYNIIKGRISDGTTFKLKHGERIEVKFIPDGAKYRIVEKAGAVHTGGIRYDCDTSISINGAGATGGNETSGGIVADGKEQVQYINKFTIYQLPSTGGLGIYWCMLGGVLLMAAASLIVYRNKRKEVL